MIAIMGAALALAGSATVAEGQSRGSISRQDFSVGQFSAVSLKTAPDVVVSVGGPPSVWAEGDADRIGALDIEVEGQTLKIDTRRGARWPEGRRRAPVIVHVRTPLLNSVAVSGSGNMRVEGVEGRSFSARVDGSGNLHVPSLRVEDATFAVSGSGNIDAAGSAITLRASSSGSGNAVLGNLAASRASISVSGSGNVRAHVSGETDIRVSGSGGATVTGGARCTVRATGSGEVHCS